MNFKQIQDIFYLITYVFSPIHDCEPLTIFVVNISYFSRYYELIITIINKSKYIYFVLIISESLRGTHFQ